MIESQPLVVSVLVGLAGLASSSPRAAAASSGGEASASEPAPASAAEPRAATGRVIVLGFDGADARTLRELMEADPGGFPNLRKLAEQGTFAPLEVVVPPESPVSWAALNTGQNPAKTGVPAFVKRQLDHAMTPAMPTLGHMQTLKVPIDELDPPIPTWGTTTYRLVGGALGFVVTALVGGLLFRRAAVALVLGLLGGGAAAYGAGVLRGYLPKEIPLTKNPNQARNVWDFAADAGVESIVLDAAQAFGMDAADGAHVLAGLGLPDARNGIGDWCVYTTDPSFDLVNGRTLEAKPEGSVSSTAGTLYLVQEVDGRIEAKIYGPKNFCEEERLRAEFDEIQDKLAAPDLSYDDSLALSTRKEELDPGSTSGLLRRYTSARDVTLRATVDMTIVREADAARITIDGVEQRVPVGKWSEFYELEFPLNRLIRVHAITRVRLVALEPFQLLVNVLDLDPRNPPFWQPVSDPIGFSGELASECGLYETYGWPTLTMPVKDSVIDPAILLEDVEFTEAWRERLTHAAFERDGWRLLFSVFSTTDRVQHMLYAHYDATNPLHRPEKADQVVRFFGEDVRLGDAIPAIYRHMDRVVGDVLARLESDDTLLVCSDHGFQSFHRQVHLNNWLVEAGYQVLKPGASPSPVPFGTLDWSRTRAYSLGMGFIYLNLEGREREGIVLPSEADALMAEIREKLLAATDPDTGARLCKQVYTVKEIHRGPYLDLEADLIVGFAPPYRVSWATTGGSISMIKRDGVDVPGPICVDNDSPWSGDHISVALEDVPGVFLSNRRFALPETGVKSLHIAPTVLALLGVPKPAEMDLDPLALE